MPRSRVLIILVAIVVAIGVGGFILYDQVLRGDSAAALGLPAASNDPAASGVPAASFDGTVAGTWNVGSGSVAGYRVRTQGGRRDQQQDQHRQQNQPGRLGGGMVVTVRVGGIVGAGVQRRRRSYPGRRNLLRPVGGQVRADRQDQ